MVRVRAVRVRVMSLRVYVHVRGARVRMRGESARVRGVRRRAGEEPRRTDRGAPLSLPCVVLLFSPLMKMMVRFRLSRLLLALIVMILKV